MTAWRNKEGFKERMHHWAGKLDVSARALFTCVRCLASGLANPGNRFAPGPQM
jgi:hypothetical protein